MRTVVRRAVALPRITRGPTAIESKPADREALNDALARAATGDRQAFAEFYDGVSSMVFGLAKRIVRSHALAEEVTQDVFMEVWSKIDRWSPSRSSAVGWTLMIARRRSIDRVRSEQATRNREDAQAQGSVRGTEPELAESIVLDEEHESVRGALESLTDKQRSVIDLAYYEGRTYSEVAETLGLPLGTVKTRMRDGLLRLRDSLGETT